MGESDGESMYIIMAVYTTVHAQANCFSRNLCVDYAKQTRHGTLRA